MKVEQIKKVEEYPWNGKMQRSTTLFLENDEREIKRTTGIDKPRIEIGDEFPDDKYEINEKKDRNDNTYFTIVQKQDQKKQFFKKSYQEIKNPRSYLVNILKETIIPIIEKKITREQVYAEMEFFLNWCDKDKSVNPPKPKEEIEPKQEAKKEEPKTEPKKPLTAKQKTILITLKQCGIDDDELHFYLEAITGVNKFHDLSEDSCQIFFDYITAIIGEREYGSVMTNNDYDRIKIELLKLEVADDIR